VEVKRLISTLTITILLSFLILALTIHGFAQSSPDTLRFEGTYHGKNLVVKNPYDGYGNLGFATKKILLNGKEIPFDNHSAFVIQLEPFQLKNGENFDLQIIYLGRSKPVILNSVSVRPIED
jgi:hypothetical protein